MEGSKTPMKCPFAGDCWLYNKDNYTCSGEQEPVGTIPPCAEYRRRKAQKLARKFSFYV